MRAQDLCFACRPCTVAPRSLIHRGSGDTSHSHLLGAMIYRSYSCLVLDVNSVVIVRNSPVLGQDCLVVMCQNKTPVITMDPVTLVNEGTEVSDQKAFAKLKKVPVTRVGSKNWLNCATPSPSVEPNMEGDKNDV